MATQEERRVLWLLAGVVEFRGKKYKEHSGQGVTAGCTGCAFIGSGPGRADFHEAFRSVRDERYCGNEVWKLAD